MPFSVFSQFQLQSELLKKNYHFRFLPNFYKVARFYVLATVDSLMITENTLKMIPGICKKKFFCLLSICKWQIYERFNFFSFRICANCCIMIKNRSCVSQQFTKNGSLKNYRYFQCFHNSNINMTYISDFKKKLSFILINFQNSFNSLMPGGNKKVAHI